MKLLTILAKIHDAYVNNVPQYFRQPIFAALIIIVAWWLMNYVHSLFPVFRACFGNLV